MTPPIIILGMHRSGTTIVSRVLERLGLFVGWQKPYENEARVFVQLNTWLLQNCGATWDWPNAIHELWTNDLVRTSAGEYFRGFLRAQAFRFLGPRRWLKYRDVGNLDVPWGWKDPRSTFTLPLWLDLFPDSRIVHVSRNGVDVARSLNVRTSNMLEYLREMNGKRRLVHFRKTGEGWSLSALRCSSLATAFEVWEDYIDEARRHVADLGDRAFEFRFEDFLQDPLPIIEPLVEFCGLQPSGPIEKAIGDLNAGRAFAYRKHEDLRRFAEQMADRLSARGYADAVEPSLAH
jgi:hypothetical protein